MKRKAMNRGQWNKDEDLKLLLAVENNSVVYPEFLNGRKTTSVTSWEAVSVAVMTRDKKQCRERWVNHLNPELRHDSWSPGEEEKLWRLGNEFPGKWALISKQLPGRSHNKIKSKFNSMAKRRKTNKQGEKLVPVEPDDQKKEMDKLRFVPSEFFPDLETATNFEPLELFYFDF